MRFETGSVVALRGTSQKPVRAGEAIRSCLASLRRALPDGFAVEEFALVRKYDAVVVYFRARQAPGFPEEVRFMRLFGDLLHRIRAGVTAAGQTFEVGQDDQ